MRKIHFFIGKTTPKQSKIGCFGVVYLTFTISLLNIYVHHCSVDLANSNNKINSTNGLLWYLSA